jgi:hypothetical protein
MNEEQNDLNKSIDTLLDEYFLDEDVEKSIDIAHDSETTADEATAKAPRPQQDEDRNAGRSKQISDIPRNDKEGRRASDYDSAISEEQDEEEPDEAKDQVAAIDQSSEKGHMASEPKAPQVRPFKKSEIDEQEWEEFQEFKKSKAEAEQKQQEEELRKAEEIRKAEQEELIKSAVEQAVAPLKEENEQLRKSFQESQELIKAMAKQPQKPKSITNIQAIEKSSAPDDQPETFSKSEMLDAAEELVKAKELPDTAAMELDMYGYVANPEHRARIEKKLQSK